MRILERPSYYENVRNAENLRKNLLNRIHDMICEGGTMALEKCGKYELRIWEDGEFSTEGSRVASYSLYEENNQVGAVYTLADNVVKDIKTDPSKKGHGTKFLELLMKRGERLGFDSFRVNSVIGHGATSEEKRENAKIMEHLLTKMGFVLIDKDERNWEIDLESFNPDKVGC